MTLKTRHMDCSETHPGCRALREAARRSGVADADNLPFMYQPQQATLAALLVHGFTATPWEMRPLAEFLAEAGIASLAVRLPGHGTSPEDLARRSWQEWQASVTEGYRLLAADYPTVFGMGMSTGCLLLLITALEQDYYGLVLFSPYLRIRHKLASYAGWLRWIRPYQVKANGDELLSRYYHRRPVAGIHQINRLLKVLRPRLSAITCPVIAFNGEGDETVQVASGRELIDQLGSAVRIHEMYGPDVPHVLTREENPCRWSMFDQAARFVQEIDHPGAPKRVT
ncbi:MAG: alpha/beta fold hydrolase [Desulfuromonadales bacterium]